MKRALLLLIAVAAPLSAARAPLGTFGRWGAFRDDGPTRCFAIAEPVQTVRGGTERAFVTVTRWPAANVRGELYVRLSRPKHPRAAVILSVGERRFRLTAGPSDAWAADPAADRAIVAAMRSGRSLSVESIAASGRPFVDAYALTGAATAIDTAALACSR